jgi:hypothetical protein
MQTYLHRENKQMNWCVLVNLQIQKEYIDDVIVDVMAPQIVDYVLTLVKSEAYGC